MWHCTWSWWPQPQQNVDEPRRHYSMWCLLQIILLAEQLVLLCLIRGIDIERTPST